MLALEKKRGALLLRIESAEVCRSRDAQLPALASVLREVLNELPEDVQAWLHAGTFDNGLVALPAGGWSLRRGREKHPRFAALERTPEAVTHFAFENQSPCCAPLGTAYTTPSSG